VVPPTAAQASADRHGNRKVGISARDWMLSAKQWHCLDGELGGGVGQSRGGPDVCAVPTAAHGGDERGSGVVTAEAPVRGSVRALRIVLWFLVLELVVVVATGVALFFFYRPSGASFPGSMEPATLTFSDVMRVAHHVAALSIVVTAITATVLGLVALRSRRRRWTIGTAGIATVVGALGAWFTGFFLAWDQLALWAVTVGTNMEGARAVFRDQVKFVLVGTEEISRGSYITLFVIHAALAVVLALLTAVVWIAASRRDARKG
jgi:quinol-cytochrome oxidoreductase complex cytochrome b subunit